ncbi:MAG: septation protein IspZ, partial [Gammaproteobacteria bacterium]|nr:septation protein IspZ [Gammaproteobacteria bacterium]
LSAMHKGTLGFNLVLGALTLFFQNEKFIQWKPTIANWAFAAAFLATHKFAQQPLVKSLFGNAVKLADKDWFSLSLMWVIFFVVVGILNLYVAYNFSMAFWVKFKVFGLLGITIVFSILQGIWLMRKGEILDADSQQEIVSASDTDILELSENSSVTDRESLIKQALKQELPDASIDLVNESHLHAGHAGAADGRGHFRLNIISPHFKGMPVLQRHQLIYRILGDMMVTDIHALAIEAKSPDEVFAN